MAPLVSKTEWATLFMLGRGVRVTCPWDSPRVQDLLTSWWPAWQPSHLFHVPARHWWDSKPGAIMPPLTAWDHTGQTELLIKCYESSTMVALGQNILSEYRHTTISLICMSTHKISTTRCHLEHQAWSGQPAIRALPQSPLRRHALGVLSLCDQLATRPLVQFPRDLQ